MYWYESKEIIPKTREKIFMKEVFDTLDIASDAWAHDMIES